MTRVAENWKQTRMFVKWNKISWMFRGSELGSKYRDLKVSLFIAQYVFVAFGN